MAGAGTGQLQPAVQPQGGQAGGQASAQPNSMQYSKAVMPSDYGAPASGGKGGIGGVLPQISNLGNSAMQGMVGGAIPDKTIPDTNLLGGPSNPRGPAIDPRMVMQNATMPNNSGQQYQVGGAQQSAQYPVDMNYTKYSGQPQQQPQMQSREVDPRIIAMQQAAQQQPQQAQQQPQQGGNPPNIFNTAAQGMNQSIKAAGMETMYQPKTIAETDLSAYMNPYESQVVGQSLQDLERSRQMQANQLAAQATGAGAFGGSRQAIMESELGRNYLDQAARTASQLRLGGFQNAQQMAGQDIGYGLQGSQNRQAAASTLGQLSNIGFGQGMELSNQAMQQGSLSQGINQMLIDAAKGQYGGYTGAPAQSLQYLTGAIGATPAPMSQTTTKQPGLFDYLTLGASMFPRK